MPLYRVEFWGEGEVEADNEFEAERLAEKFMQVRAEEVITDEEEED